MLTICLGQQIYLQILQDALQKICASVRGLQEELQKQKAHVGILEAFGYKWA